MNTFYMFRGVPGSGKSTIAKNLKKSVYMTIGIVNRDTIRNEMGINSRNWTRELEKTVVKKRDEQIFQFMKMKYDIISDDTNFSPDCRQTFKKMCSDNGYDFIEIDVKTPLDVCYIRDSKREDEQRVGPHIIAMMAKKSGFYTEKELKEFNSKYLQDKDNND